jgi:hypothetical protein
MKWLIYCLMIDFIWKLDNGTFGRNGRASPLNMIAIIFTSSWSMIFL